MGDDTPARLLEAILAKEDAEREARWSDEDVAMFVWAMLEPFGFSVTLPYSRFGPHGDMELKIRVTHYGLRPGEKAALDLNLSRYVLEQARVDVDRILVSEAQHALSTMFRFGALQEVEGGL